MESGDRLDLEAALARWRASTALDPQTLDELENHLRDAYADAIARGLSPSAAFSRALSALGNSVQLTGEFSKLRNIRHSTTMLHSLLESPRLRRYARQFALAVVIVLSLRAFLLTPYRAVGASVAPEIPAGSHVLAWRVAPKFAPGDIAVYRNGDHTFLGRVTAVSDTGLTVARTNQPEQTVARAAVIGRVVLTTR